MVLTTLAAFCFQTFFQLPDNRKAEVVRQTVLELNFKSRLLRGEPFASSPSPTLAKNYFATAFWRRMMPANARSESFTVSALEKNLATSGSNTTTFVPRW